jgi:pyruvate/2-oxoglutarate dehydrogenase complex dihydrolipoamide acyltransferase (E2) component
MNIEVELPDLGDDAGDEAVVSEWRYEEGELVDKDESLVEVVARDETVEVASPASGILIERFVEEGDVVRVGDVLALVEERGEDEDILTEDEDE